MIPWIFLEKYCVLQTDETKVEIFCSIPLMIGRVHSAKDASPTSSYICSKMKTEY